MILIDGYKATPISLSQFHAKSNKEEMLNAFVITLRSSFSTYNFILSSLNLILRN